MRILDTALLRIGLAFWGFFAFLIGTETGFLSARFRGEGILFRWQLWLLAAIFVTTLRDQLASMRCPTCHQWKAHAVGGWFRLGRVICQPCREHDVLSGQLEALSLNSRSERILL